MSLLTSPRAEIYLLPFREQHAATLVSWVKSESEMRWLAPSTPPPLTEEKVLSWQKPGGHAFVGYDDSCGDMVAYGELNPMGHRSDRLWIGHCLIRPDRRGRGIGQTFVRVLLKEAFDHLKSSRVSLIVFPDNQPAVRCYQRAGFAFISEEWHTFVPGRPERLMKLEALPPGRKQR